jgi:hypothetical protein
MMEKSISGRIVIANCEERSRKQSSINIVFFLDCFGLRPYNDVVVIANCEERSRKQSRD